MEQLGSALDQIQSLLRALGSLGVAGTIVIGVLAGIAATLLMPGDDPSGFIVTPLVGIAGSVLATWLGQYVHLTVAGEWSGFVAAVVGAMLILLAYRIIFRRRG
jgi:uncharacterized membrane protein YeaQ/YmgE (transglycosylase-associated protein family)